jgi:spore coat protein JC
MWIYEKKLECPVNIKKRDPSMAKLIITQYGGAYSNKSYYID